MIYIDSMQFETIKQFFKVERVVEFTDPFLSKLYEEYRFDELFRVSDSMCTISYVLVFKCDNVKIFANIFVCDSYKKILNVFSINSFLLLNKEDINILFGDSVNTQNIFVKELAEIQKKCKQSSVILKVVSCGEICNINILSDIKLSDKLIEEYLYDNFDCKSNIEHKIFSCSQKEVYFQIQAVFNTVQYFYQLRTVNKAKVVSEGNGYIFFEINNYIFGFQKYYNFLDSPLTYYLINRTNREIFVFALNNSNRQVLRLGQSLLANEAANLGGMNLHAAAVVYNNKAILLTGDKESGKTTNLLFGLKHNKDFKIMSNDIIHLFNKNNETYALGSPRKVTIRPATIGLFDELLTLKYNEYDSVGNANSNNIQLVKSINEISEMFGNDVQYCAPLGLIVFIKYEKDLKEIVIEEITYNEAINILNKQEHTFYNGREKFWDDILSRKSCPDFSIIRNVCFIKVNVSKANIHKTWDRIIEYI